MTKDLRTALYEQLAALEHERWSGWQQYLHSLCTRNDDGSLTIPADRVTHWERQIATPYAELSEREKQSDREQVDRYWHLIPPAPADGARVSDEQLYRKCSTCDGSGFDASQPCATVTTGPYGGVCMTAECPDCDHGYVPVAPADDGTLRAAIERIHRAASAARWCNDWTMRDILVSDLDLIADAFGLNQDEDEDDDEDDAVPVSPVRADPVA